MSTQQPASMPTKTPLEHRIGCTDVSASLASAVGCFTEDQLCELAGITPSTAESWRKRGTGPAYTVFGNRFLYPCEGVARFIQERLRSRERVTARAVI